MGRMNEGTTDIKIPGTNEIIPAGGLASYNTIDCHFNPKLYPEPMKWDPARFGDGRKEIEQEAYGYQSPNPEFIPPTTTLKELAPALPRNLYVKAVPKDKT
ncbi:hypothetical protein B7463_g2382, partial [Scytalidium lignicola]